MVKRYSKLKYRIVKKYTHPGYEWVTYHLEYKGWLFWNPMTNLLGYRAVFNTAKDAEDALNRYLTCPNEEVVKTYE